MNRQSPSLLTDQDLYLFNEGSHFRLYDKLGAHVVARGSIAGADCDNGTYFAVWAPNADHVSVIGEFNGWAKGRDCLQPIAASGIWEGFIPNIGKGALYKYHIGSRFNGYAVDKADPYSIFNEIPPKFASIVWDLDYQWNDQSWMAGRRDRQGMNKPMAIYEMHVGSCSRHNAASIQKRRMVLHRVISCEQADDRRMLG